MTKSYPDTSTQYKEQMLAMCTKIQNALLNATGVLHIAEIHAGLSAEEPLFYLSVDVAPPISQKFEEQIDALMKNSGFTKLSFPPRATAIFKNVPEQIAFCDLCGEENSRPSLAPYTSNKFRELMDNKKIPFPFDMITSIMQSHNISRRVAEEHFLHMIKTSIRDDSEWLLCHKCVSSIHLLSKGE